MQILLLLEKPLSFKQESNTQTHFWSSLVKINGHNIFISNSIISDQLDLIIAIGQENNFSNLLEAYRDKTVLVSSSMPVNSEISKDISPIFNEDQNLSNSYNFLEKFINFIIKSPCVGAKTSDVPKDHFKIHLSKTDLERLIGQLEKLTSDSKKLMLDDFLYHLPDELIAQKPLDSREDSRLLVRSFQGKIEDSLISSLDMVVPKNSLLILNDSRVFPSRILTKTPHGGKLEIMLLEPSKRFEERNVWRAIGKPLRKLKTGYQIDLGDDCHAEIISQPGFDLDPLVFEIEFNLEMNQFYEWLNQNGYIPLPPYISRKEPVKALHSDDTERYQTVYANELGSVAAPTAGLHLTDNLIEKLKRNGVKIASVTLHVGGGTFLPVKENDISKHVMHRESYFVPKRTLQMIDEAIANRQKIIAVGTTTFRTLESYFSNIDRSEKKSPFAETDLFIHPRRIHDVYQSKIVDALMTNFHQPGSTLFMLISALIGYQNALDSYRHAIESGYRFLSYGDSSIFWLR